LHCFEIDCIWVKWNSCRREKHYLKFLGKFTKIWRHLDTLVSLSWLTWIMDDFPARNAKFYSYFWIIWQKVEWYFIWLRNVKNNKINLAEFWSLCANLGYCKSKLWGNIY
jgi:hypothetical protein